MASKGRSVLKRVQHFKTDSLAQKKSRTEVLGASHRPEFFVGVQSHLKRRKYLVLTLET